MPICALFYSKTALFAAKKGLEMLNMWRIKLELFQLFYIFTSAYAYVAWVILKPPKNIVYVAL